MSEITQRLRAKAFKRAQAVDKIARILWENGQILADAEADGLPTWDEICATHRAAPEIAPAKLCDAHMRWWLDHTHRAEALLAIDAADALTLAALLIESAARQHKDVERQLWRLVEKAEGRAAGALSGGPP